MTRSARGFVLGAVVGAAAAALLLAWLRRAQRLRPLAAYTRPRGGEREGEFELFIGS